ncbi:response regulator transcription factor [Bifidobacterium sp. ESL0790]|uniref:response regulator n=1 Tax=Bifidobacterium sp. ESL0790 TaxID=2983233 RepID=UPI0023F82875|nr:response regulator transcription factor [Bifidobacterium sp. ESL0790]WEV71918.1 response regulator transcription factor [Bifidobacterium sp. ESL0790]
MTDTTQLKPSKSSTPTSTRPIRLLIVDDQELILTGLAELVSYMPGVVIAARAISGEETLVLGDDVLRNIDVALIDARMPQMGGPELIARLGYRYPNIKCILLTAFDADDNLVNSLQAGAVGYLLKDVSTADLDDAIHRAAAGGRVIGASATAHAMRIIAESGKDRHKNTGLQRTSDDAMNPSNGIHPSGNDKYESGETPLTDTEPTSGSGLATRAADGSLDDRDSSQSPTDAETQALLAELTPRNRQIAMLIAQGRTNSEIADQLFLSPGTVKNHASRIFAHLNVRNRTELTALLNGTLD